MANKQSGKKKAFKAPMCVLLLYSTRKKKKRDCAKTGKEKGNKFLLGDRVFIPSYNSILMIL